MLNAEQQDQNKRLASNIQSIASELGVAFPFVIANLDYASLMDLDEAMRLIKIKRKLKAKREADNGKRSKQKGRFKL